MKKDKQTKHMKSRGEYMEKHDAFFDKEKDIWLEEECGDQNCNFCNNRPTKPSEVTALTSKENSK